MKKLLLFITVFSLAIAQECCEAEQEAIDNCGGLGCFIPQCTDDCEWESMQCWNSTGYCWCVDVDGVEIDGTSQPSWQGLPECGIEILLGDVNFDEQINVLDIVLIVSFILMTDYPDDNEFNASDITGDGAINVMDIVLIVQMILNPEDSIQINSGTTFGECLGYCSFGLELDNGFASFIATGSGLNGVLPDLSVDEILSDNSWQYLLELIDFEYFQSLDDVFGCPDCDDGGAEYIEIIYNGISKQVNFEAYSEINGIEELILLLRELREDYWNQLNEPQLPESCYLEPDSGPCFGYIPMYYYNLVSRQCEMFIYGGCAGIVPFQSIEECQITCE